eukprot:6923517-Pyramimonas_sp.AAC.1
MPKRFGESLTADHVVLAADDAADKRAGAIMAHPAKHKAAETTKALFLELVTPNDEAKRACADMSSELLKTCP